VASVRKPKQTWAVAVTVGDEVVDVDFVEVPDELVDVVDPVLDVVLGGDDIEPKSPTPLSQEMMLTPTDTSSLTSLVIDGHESDVPSAAAGAGVIVLAQVAPVGWQPITLLQVVDEEAQDAVEAATHSVLQELTVVVVHDCELGFGPLGSLESTASWI
jgi:hypothetical protein